MGLGAGAINWEEAAGGRLDTGVLAAHPPS